MRIHEIIFENVLGGKTGSKTTPVKEIFGGGTLKRTIQTSSNGTQSAYSNEYTDAKGNTIIKHEFKNNQHTWYDNNNPKGMGYHQGGITMEEMDQQFSKTAANHMTENFNKISKINNMKDDDILSRMNRFGKNIRESKNMKNNLEPMISDQFREFLAACEWSRQNMGKIITEWPAGWEVTTTLEEDTTVNMSPYKDSIQNAETPKKKSAKNKIGELTRK